MPSPADVFWRFFVIGATLFGSGHLLAAYMQRTFVDGLHWLTPQQLVDTLAIGQATPGPLTSTSAAAGYIMTVQPSHPLSGIAGALTAAVGAFLPAFAVVMILGKIVPYLRRHPIAQAFLKGVNAGVIALLLGAFASLAYSTLIASGVDWLSLALTAIAFVLLERFRWSPIALIIAGAGVGVLRAVVGI
jgi:chromate transporter